MAIKMDGHTITALQLKASDGSEVTKQLTEEGTIPTPSEALSITANGTYDVTTKASAVVNVPAHEINLQNKTATANGEVTADEGYDGLGVVTVNVSGDTPTYQEKTATQNGVVLPDEGYDALSKVTVNVPAPILPTLTNPASASDILNGKEALDGDGAKLTGTCTFDADTSDADATASDIAEGKTAYVNGSKITGTGSGGGSNGVTLLAEGTPVTLQDGGHQIACGLSLNNADSGAVKKVELVVKEIAAGASGSVILAAFKKTATTGKDGYIATNGTKSWGASNPTITTEAVGDKSKITVDNLLFTGVDEQLGLCGFGAGWAGEFAFYSVKGWDANDTLIMDLKPCQRNCDNLGGFWDNVRNRWVGNVYDMFGMYVGIPE